MKNVVASSLRLIASSSLQRMHAKNLFHGFQRKSLGSQVSVGKFCFSKTSHIPQGDSQLKELRTILSDPLLEIHNIPTKLMPIKTALENMDISLIQEFHKQLAKYYTDKLNSSVSEAEKKNLNALILLETLSCYFSQEPTESKAELSKTCDKLVQLFTFKGELPFSFANEQQKFETLLALSQIFNVHKKDDSTLLAFELLQNTTPLDVKQRNSEQYIESLCQRVILSQFMRDHDATFHHLDHLFAEVNALTLEQSQKMILSKINQFCLKGILLSTQFDRPEKQLEYQQIQHALEKQYNYESSTIEKLILQVKEISLKHPNYIQLKGQDITRFIENHKLNFSKQVQDVLLYQLYNQVVPLNIFEYFYMLVKFEANYREEAEEIPKLLQGPPEELVDNYQELIQENITVLLEIRQLITQFTNQVIGIKTENPFPSLEISSWIEHLDQVHQLKIKQAFEKNEQFFV